VTGVEFVTRIFKRSPLHRSNRVIYVNYK